IGEWMLAVLDDVRLARPLRTVDAALVRRQRPEDGHAAALYWDLHTLVRVCAFVADKTDRAASVGEQTALMRAGQDRDTAVLRRRVVQRQPECQIRAGIHGRVPVILMPRKLLLALRLLEDGLVPVEVDVRPQQTRCDGHELRPEAERFDGGVILREMA